MSCSLSFSCHPHHSVYKRLPQSLSFLVSPALFLEPSCLLSFSLFVFLLPPPPPVSTVPLTMAQALSQSRYDEEAGAGPKPSSFSSRNSSAELPPDELSLLRVTTIQHEREVEEEEQEEELIGNNVFKTSSFFSSLQSKWVQTATASSSHEDTKERKRFDFYSSVPSTGSRVTSPSPSSALPPCPSSSALPLSFDVFPRRKLESLEMRMPLETSYYYSPIPAILEDAGEEERGGGGAHAEERETLSLSLCVWQKA